MAYLKNHVPDGYHLELYNNGNMREQYWYREGNLSDTARFYYVDGGKKMVVTYARGRVVNIKKYDEEGYMVASRDF